MINIVKFLPGIVCGEASPLPGLLRPQQLLMVRDEEAAPMPQVLPQLAIKAQVALIEKNF